MRSDSAPLRIYCSPAAAKVSTSYIRVPGTKKSHADGWARVESSCYIQNMSHRANDTKAFAANCAADGVIIGGRA
jgi:hypothetical protein